MDCFAWSRTQQQRGQKADSKWQCRKTFFVLEAAGSQSRCSSCLEMLVFIFMCLGVSRRLFLEYVLAPQSNSRLKINWNINTKNPSFSCDQLVFLKYSKASNSMFWGKENWLVLLMIFTNCYMSLKKWREHPIWKKFLCHRTQTHQTHTKTCIQHPNNGKSISFFKALYSESHLVPARQRLYGSPG